MGRITGKTVIGLQSQTDRQKDRQKRQSEKTDNRDNKKRNEKFLGAKEVRVGGRNEMKC